MSKTDVQYPKKNVWLIGTGPMAIEHFKVLRSLDCNITVVGRGENSANEFFLKTGIKPFTGGISAYLTKVKPDQNTWIIISTGTENLAEIVVGFKNLNFKRILIEKPGAINTTVFRDLYHAMKHDEKKIFIAYNRRYLQSVKRAREIINEDGGILTLHFDFTEWSHRINELKKADGVKENWLFANSSHVIDLAIYFMGKPAKINSFSSKGSLDWHEFSFFSGSGISENGVLFSYNSNWESGGRWSIQLTTTKRKMVLEPLEELMIIDKGTTDIKRKIFKTTQYKEGVEEQLINFLLDKNLSIPTLNSQFENCKVYDSILNKLD
jgi:predicted dehydrogenase